MNNKTYEIRRDYADGQEVLHSLSKADRAKVESAIAGLATEPMPQEFSAKSCGGGDTKMTIPVEDDVITVLYEVNFFKATVDIVRIERRGPLAKAVEWLAGLTKFEPKGKK
jgi:hypothetical protein